MTHLINWDGNPISKPGLYTGVPLELYHGQLTVAPSASSSTLRQIESESPLHWYDQSYLNPNREEPEQKDYFTLGTAVHSLLLGEKGFNDRFIVRPEAWKDWRKQEARDWRDAAIAEGLGVLTPDDLATIKGIAASVSKEPLVQQGLLSGTPEASMVWQDSETGVWLKARPDVLMTGADLLVDLKTIASADGVSCRRAIADHGYHIQLGLAAEGYEILTGRQIQNDSCLLLFVEKKRPFGVNLKPISAEAIYYGRQIVRRAVRTFAKCLETGEWGGYSDSGSTAYLPAWAENKLKAEAEAGLLPDPLITMKQRSAA